MKKIVKKTCVLAMVLVTLLVSSVTTCMAAGITAVTQKGVVSLGNGTASITINSNSESQSLKGKTFHLYQLFYAENSTDLESIQYTFHETCKTALQNVVGTKLGKAASDVTEYEVIDYIQSLNTHKVEGAQAEQEEEGYYSDFRYFIEELRDELVKLGDTAADVISVTDVRADGSVLIQGLEYGYYVLDEVTSNEGTHSASSLCMVDTANPTSEITIKSDYPTVQKKVQEDDNKDALSNEGWNDMADFEIGQKVPYKFVSNVPDMNGYDTYYYAWHDVLDEALTFDPDSVEVVISSDQGEYTLADSEFTVKEKEGTDSFVVEITDLKKIVDRYFDQMDDLGHNVYGQTVTLYYQAVLNDLAVSKTGASGYENQVRLEFSNDPDVSGKGKTGFTPWDTVVCFSYRLDGLKVNNYEKVLEGASFRLYRDADCTDEVYVKKGSEGYIVIHTDTAGTTRPKDAVEMESDANGEFSIIGLDSGTYYLKETKAPTGYRKLRDPIKLDITATYTTDRNNYVKGDGANLKALEKLEFSAYIKEFLDGAYTESTSQLETDIKTGTGNLTVVNTVGSKLPFTGSAATLLLIGAGTAFMAASQIIGRKKREDEVKAE